MSEAERLRAEYCKPAQTAHDFEEIPFRGGTANILSFQNIRANLNSACASCHALPATSGGFSYLDAWKGEEVSVGGVVKWYPGYFEAAEKMRDYIMHADPAKRMPPPERRTANPEAFMEMGRQLNYWIVAGKPNSTFEAGKLPEERKGKFRPERPRQTTDLGDCIPTAKAAGFDEKTDHFFANTKTLPKFLVDTDMFTLEPFALAQRGTFAYNVEYPLWADNADKGRWIHVPMKMEDGVLKRQAIVPNPVTGQFDIPENTRFYKSFYRAVLLPSGKKRMRRVETRIIVVRYPAETSLFGTYQWDETEQIATLVEAPYRDGTSWKDLKFQVTQADGKDIPGREYLIPGRQRCIDCHQGSSAQNFVLGFTPLQINKRNFGGAGRIDPARDHDLDQVQRLISYGVLGGIKSAKELPVLERSGQLPPKNVYELRASGYMTGNCYHCHNPNGMARKNDVTLSLGPGDIFQFSTHQRSTQIATRKFVDQNGDLEASHIWRKVVDPPAAQGMFSQMPMHTPGSPDCRVLTVVGKWIRSVESESAAEEFKPDCKKENPFTMLEMDFTWPSSEIYTPRRSDWSNPAQGMPARYRDMELTPALKEAILTEYAVGYWRKKPECNFPVIQDLPVEKRRSWMMNGDKPKRPFGEVYYTSPGSYYFRNTCQKCHGPMANGDSPLAKGILNWSGGEVRVANLIDGMFGKKNENLKTFDLDGRNLGGNYLVWMAMEGTRVRFPPELSGFMGKHGGQMLNGIREKCLTQISSSKKSSPIYMDHEVFNKVCFMDNLYPSHPDLQFDPATDKPRNPEAVEAWLDKGAWNAGWAIFEFLREASEKGFRPGLDQCELVFKKEGS